MRFERDLSIKNLKRKPTRTAALILLAAFLSFSVFGGSVIVMGLQNGLSSYEARLGADIVVVPYEAQTKGALESILLQGIPGYFYMDDQYFQKIRSIEGVETAAPQFFLASASAGCCSVPVQIIGFDPETDFSIQPWIRVSYGGSIGDGDVIVGGGITMPDNGTLTFYDTEVRVVAQLDETGTGLDTAVYANMNTIKQMMANAQTLGFHYFDDVDPDGAVSSVMVKVADGYSIEDVCADINIHVRHVEATQAKSMISSIAGGLGSVSRVIGLLTAMIWVLAVGILMIAFVMISNERMKEFAVLRVVGASQRMVCRLLRVESALVSLAGATLGVLAALAVIVPVGNLIRAKLELPYLLPGAGVIAALVAGSVAVSVLAGWATSFISVRRVGKNEAGLILREGA